MKQERIGKFLNNYPKRFRLNTYDNSTEAILETYNRLFEEWKSNETFLRELMLVLNHRVSFWAKQHRKEQMNKKYLEYELLYLDLCVKTRKYRRRKFYSETRKNWQIIE